VETVPKFSNGAISSDQMLHFKVSTTETSRGLSATVEAYSTQLGRRRAVSVCYDAEYSS